MGGSVGTASSIDSECGLKLRKNEETFLAIFAAVLCGLSDFRFVTAKF